MNDDHNNDAHNDGNDKNDDPIRMQLGSNLLNHRREAGLTQEELGQSCDVHRTEISLLERGEYYPRLDTLVKLARGLKLESPAELLEGISSRSADA